MQTYKVVGPRAVDGHQPGEKYEADYSAVKAGQLIAGGHIKVVAAKDAPKDDLLAQATAAGVDQAETMTKAELIAALNARSEPAQEGGS